LVASSNSKGPRRSYGWLCHKRRKFIVDSAQLVPEASLASFDPSIYRRFMIEEQEKEIN
jgi:hypothetical protein